MISQLAQYNQCTISKFKHKAFQTYTNIFNVHWKRT